MKAYIFINGMVIPKTLTKKNEADWIDLDEQFSYELCNYGISKKFENCKQGAIEDITKTPLGNLNIIPNSYIGIFEVDLDLEEYDSIDDNSFLADFDILEKVNKNKDKLIFSAMYDSKKNYVENFINQKNMEY